MAHQQTASGFSVQFEIMANVLIVDDDPLVLETLSQMMISANYTIATAGNGVQALKLLQKQSPDLIIMDMIMPEMEGLETIRQIRAMHPSVKIIAISGGGSLRPQDYLEMARKLGADFALTKPLDREELLNAARSLISSPPV